MWAEKRRVTTLVYFLTLASTLFFCFADFVPHEARLWCVLASLCVQWCALLWYSLSYVPFAHAYVASILGMMCCGCCEEKKPEPALGVPGFLA